MPICLHLRVTKDPAHLQNVLEFILKVQRLFQKGLGEVLQSQD